MPEGKLTKEEKLFDAIRRDDIVEVERLLNEGADVNARDGYNWSPLHVACYHGRHGRTDTATLLLDRGADVNARDETATTPLHTACWWGRTDIARLLIERGADADVRDNGGDTPIDYACDLPESDPRREPLLEIFRDLAPEAYFTKFCESPGRMPGRGM